MAAIASIFSLWIFLNLSLLLKSALLCFCSTFVIFFHWGSCRDSPFAKEVWKSHFRKIWSNIHNNTLKTLASLLWVMLWLSWFFPPLPFYSAQLPSGWEITSSSPAWLICRLSVKLQMFPGAVRLPSTRTWRRERRARGNGERKEHGSWQEDWKVMKLHWLRKNAG